MMVTKISSEVFERRYLSPGVLLFNGTGGGIKLQMVIDRYDGWGFLG